MRETDENRQLFSRNVSLHISTLSLLHQKVVTDHILHHLSEGIEKFGPVHATWMFAYETFNLRLLEGH